MNSSIQNNFDKGIFCLSFDFELAWGMYDIGDLTVLEQKARLTRERVIPKLFELLEKYQISATWAVVGHLFLESCNGKHGDPEPKHSWFPDWFSVDPASNEQQKPEWYARSLIEQLVKINPKQDIGLHGFSHCIWSDAGCDIEVARKEMQNSFEAAESLGIKPQSFVYPRNLVNHIEVLSEYGIRTFRDENDTWYKNYPRKVQKVCHILCQYLGTTPSTIKPVKVNNVLSIPASYMYISMDGFRKTIPVSSRVRSVKKGIQSAFQNKKIFHMFTHPINFAYDDNRTNKLLNGIEQIFKHATDLRDKQKIDILNMAEISQLVSGS